MAQLAQDVVRRRVFADAFRRVNFELHWLKKRELLKRRRSLQTPHDYFRFARKAFKLVQIEEEITGFLDFTRQINPKLVCEIGTRTCGTSFLLTQAIESVEVFLGLDLFVENWSRLKCFARPDQELTPLYGSSYAPETIQRVQEILKGRPIDLLFIDGDHSYEGAKKDFLAYRPFVREGGIIAFHDIVPIHADHPGPQSAYSGGVPILWNEIKPHFDHKEFIGNPNQNGFGIGAIVQQANASL